MANFRRRGSRAAGRLKRNRCASLAHLLRPHRRAPPAPYSRMEQTVDRFLSWRRCNGGYGQTGVSKCHTANARRGKARPRSVGIVAASSYSAWLRRKKDRNSANGYSARRISIPRAELSAPRCRGRMAINASWPLDREERPAGHAPRFCEFSEPISELNPAHCWRGAFARRAPRVVARTEDRQSRFFYRFHFSGANAGALLCVTHFPAPERNWP